MASATRSSSPCSCVALVVVEHAERPLVLGVGDRDHAGDDVAAPAGQVDVLDAAVRVAAAALGEAEPLEVVDEADHRALVDPQPPAQRALGHRAVGVDDREHLRVLAADPVARERALEAFRRVLGDEGGEVARPVGERLGEGRVGSVDRCHVENRTARRSS